MQKTRTKKSIKTSKIVLSIFIALGAVFIFAAPLVHIEMPKKNPVVESYKKELRSKVTVIDDEIIYTKSQYEEGKITGDQAYNLIINELQPKRAKLIEDNDELIDNKIDEHRVFGWKTWRALANGWGIRLPYIFFAILISVFVFALNTKNKQLKISLFFLQMSTFTMAFYQQVYTFWPYRDLPLRAYRGTIIAVCILISLASIFFIRYLSNRSNRFKSIIRFLNGVLITDVPPLVKDEKEYQEQVMWPTLKKVRDDV
ncbi:hypothetical protein [Spongiimicrobium salis]|uniref:hypothetical protein n=1 Tax=Spongiimicrobium salis TaxID=1667022 RepID=UPI00374D4DE4